MMYNIGKKKNEPICLYNIVLKTTYVRFEEDLFVRLSDFLRLLYQVKKNNKK